MSKLLCFLFGHKYSLVDVSDQNYIVRSASMCMRCQNVQYVNMKELGNE